MTILSASKKLFSYNQTLVRIVIKTRFKPAKGSMLNCALEFAFSGVFHQIIEILILKI